MISSFTLITFLARKRDASTLRLPGKGQSSDAFKPIDQKETR